MRAGTAEAFSTRTVTPSLEEARAEAPRRVPPEAHLAGPAGLAGVLRSGRFRVEGDVVFDPLKAFDRQPDFEKLKLPPDQTLLAREPIRFSYS